MPTKHENQLSPDLLAGTGLNIAPSQNSGSRLQMNSSQMTQILNVADATDRRCFTGMEPHYGKLTFGAVAPNDLTVLRTFELYPVRPGMMIRQNPEQIVIYEHEVETISGRRVMQVDFMTIAEYHAIHQNFGFRFKKFAPINDHVMAGTRFTGPPSLTHDGNWRFGLETNTAFMTVPQIIEDGVVVSESYCKRLKTTGIETFNVSFGSKEYPLNLYGDDDEYRILPDIGESVNEDGILITTRPYDDYMLLTQRKNDEMKAMKEADDMAIVQMSRHSLKHVDSKYDNAIYIKPNARVLDIRVTHNPFTKDSRTPEGMVEQIQKYASAQKIYYQDILRFYYSLKRERRESLNISPAFHALIVKAMSYNENQARMEIVNRGIPVDEWQLDITVEYDIIPTIGYKLSGMAGNKAVIVDVRPDHEMPVDVDGNRAELIMDPISFIKRMNPAVATEQYLNAASRDVTKRLRQMYENKESFQAMSDLLLDYYSIVNQDMVEMVSDENGLVREDHLEKVLNDPLGIKLWTPSNLQNEYTDIIRDINEKYPPTFGPVKYTGMSRKEVTTKKNVLIGSIYIILLEKTGHLWQGCSSSRFGPFGTPAKLTGADRNAAAGRVQPIRFGESEMRLFYSCVGGRATANLVDRTTNPIARKHIQQTILRSEKPTAIVEMLDRSKFKNGQGRILSIIRHIHECNGFEFTDK